MDQSRAPYLGYLILYVDDVVQSMRFYEKTFALERGMLTEQGDYGELLTSAGQKGGVKLAFASKELAQSSTGLDFTKYHRKNAPFELGFVTQEVEALYHLALKNGASPLKECTTKPWGQLVAYVQDPDGHLVEICSPLPEPSATNA